MPFADRGPADPGPADTVPADPAEGGRGLLTRAACLAQIMVDDLDTPVPGAEDASHVAKALRARNGERVSVTDGRGRWRITKWQDARLVLDGEVFVEPPRPDVAVCMSLVKGDRPEWAVQKLTEIGVDAISVLIGSDHGVVRWTPEKQERNLSRLRRVAYEAAMQSRRVYLPRVEIVDRLTDLADDYAIAEPGGGPLSSSKVAIGPEGGWSERELGSGRVRCGLGPTILRTETAAVAAGVRLCDRRVLDDGFVSSKV